MLWFFKRAPVKLSRPRGGRVKAVDSITGKLRKHTAVQLFVLARDGKWHLQPPVVYRKRFALSAWRLAFSGVVYFGGEQEQVPQPASYVVAAVVTNQRGQGPFLALPQGEKALIEVTRTQLSTLDSPTT